MHNAYPTRSAIAVTQVLGEDEGHRAGVERYLVGVVAPAVDDDQGGDRQAARLSGHGGQHRADVVLLLEGADQAHDGRGLEIGVAAVELPA